MKLNKYPRQIFTIENFCTQQECEELIRRSNDTGYSIALVNLEVRAGYMPEYRNNSRLFDSNLEVATKFWLRLEAIFNLRLGNSVPIGLNELFRFYKYEAGEYFKKHRDSPYERSETELSYFTFLLYLNEGFSGGETTFDELIITPKTGMVLIFPHELLHEGRAINAGVKYVLRSDIMYRFEAV